MPLSIGVDSVSSDYRLLHGKGISRGRRHSHHCLRVERQKIIAPAMLDFIPTIGDMAGDGKGGYNLAGMYRSIIKERRPEVNFCTTVYVVKRCSLGRIFVRQFTIWLDWDAMACRERVYPPSASSGVGL